MFSCADQFSATPACCQTGNLTKTLFYPQITRISTDYLFFICESRCLITIASRFIDDAVGHMARRYQGDGGIAMRALIVEEEIGVERLEKGSLVETAEK